MSISFCVIPGSLYGAGGHAVDKFYFLGGIQTGFDPIRVEAGVGQTYGLGQKRETLFQTAGAAFRPQHVF